MLRLLRRVFLAALACVAALGLVVGVAVLWAWAGQSEFSPRERAIIRKELGWKIPKGGRAELKEMVARDPMPVLYLLAHDSERVRAWAESLLVRNGYVSELNDDALDAIAAELNGTAYPGHGYDRPSLIGILRLGGERGLSRLTSFYRSNRPMNPLLHQEISNQIRYGWSDGKLGEKLLEIVKDNAVITENRCLAANALESMLEPAFSHTYDQEVMTAIASLRSLLPDLPDPVAATVRLTLQEIERKEREGYPAHNHYPGDGHVISPAKDRGADARIALKDKADWLRVGWAAEKLARHGIKEAIPELRRVAADHWYAPVRKVAEQAVRVLEGEETALPPSHRNPDSILGAVVLQYEKEAFAAWRKAHPGSGETTFQKWSWEIEHKLKPLRNMVIRNLQPKFDRLMVEESGRLPVIVDFEDFRLRPTESIRFARGRLLGYDYGEFGAGTVFYRKGEIARYFNTPNVHFFFRAQLGVLILCEEAMLGDRSIYLAREGPDGRISVNFFLRLPVGFGMPESLRSGETRIPCAIGDIIISNTGEIRSVPHPDK